jgi:hypothetical protein
LALRPQGGNCVLKRYAPEAWERGDVEALARIHNGGPRGHQKAATLAYARKLHGLRPPMNMHPYFTALVIFAVVVVLLGIAVVAVLMSGSDRLYPPDDREEDDED